MLGVGVVLVAVGVGDGDGGDAAVRRRIQQASVVVLASIGEPAVTWVMPFPNALTLVMTHTDRHTHTNTQGWLSFPQVSNKSRA